MALERDGGHWANPEAKPEKPAWLDVEPLDVFKLTNVLEELNRWTRDYTRFNLSFREQEPFGLSRGAGEPEQLPHGFIVSAMPQIGFFKCPMDSMKLEQALRAGLEQAGIKAPDIRRTQHGVWLNSGTVNRMLDVMNDAAVNVTIDRGKFPFDRFKENFSKGFKSVVGNNEQIR